MSEQLPLAIDAPAIAPRPPRHREMIRLYGRCEGKQCRQCRHLVRTRWGLQHYLKCEVSGVTQSAATDWRAGWEACGRFEERGG